MFDPDLLQKRLATLEQKDRELIMGLTRPPDTYESFADMRGYHQYTKRRRVMPGYDSQPMMDWLLSQKPSNNLRKIYIHFPFCRSRCLYCGFFMGFNRPEKVKNYLSALLREIRQKAKEPWVRSAPFHCVYLGGGTPSDLEPDQLRLLLDTVRENLPLANDCEITLEGRLKGFDKERRQAAIESGVNRFSFGVQSFDTQVRKQMGRKLAREELLEALKEITDQGKALVIVDLIYGLPDQDMDVWQRDLDDLLQSGVDGASGYMLRTAVNNPLEKAVRANLLPAEADLPQRGRMYARLRKTLLAAGWKRLNMTHWGRNSRERCLYDSESFSDTDMVGLGCAAHGQVNGFGAINFPILNGYLSLIERGKWPVFFCTQSPPEYRAYFDVADQTGMRMISFERFRQKFGLDLEPVLGWLTDQWQKIGLLTPDQHRMVMSGPGEFWQPNLSQAMIDCLDLASPDFDMELIDNMDFRKNRRRFNRSWFERQKELSPNLDVSVPGPGLAEAKRTPRP
ncbi:heme anaerobic degradation radical SAM methyltransferase ChuW/HutW [Dethiosulfatarculus sandiegensis]|uniref:Radical SAM core domain-containing protein n=1 Tax=Dethiosulfatarculus sandiegensis TaxID=1429043 RepID=A0A0D2JF65_9BACT|nr:heme anaerobic degradation radical SAM methyltransferase ChuW/HutW [Dethiosulfatarculus sandiegensis]KIX14341.1 hypothetical protein X474_08765 [Dethiosulfatarculus sandiegensis]